MVRSQRGSNITRSPKTPPNSVRSTSGVDSKLPSRIEYCPTIRGYSSRNRDIKILIVLIYILSSAILLDYTYRNAINEYYILSAICLITIPILTFTCMIIYLYVLYSSYELVEMKSCIKILFCILISFIAIVLFRRYLNIEITSEQYIQTISHALNILLRQFLYVVSIIKEYIQIILYLIGISIALIISKILYTQLLMDSNVRFVLNMLLARVIAVCIIYAYAFILVNCLILDTSLFCYIVISMLILASIVYTIIHHVSIKNTNKCSQQSVNAYNDSDTNIQIRNSSSINNVRVDTSTNTQLRNDMYTKQYTNWYYNKALAKYSIVSNDCISFIPTDSKYRSKNIVHVNASTTVQIRQNTCDKYTCDKYTCRKYELSHKKTYVDPKYIQTGVQVSNGNLDATKYVERRVDTDTNPIFLKSICYNKRKLKCGIVSNMHIDIIPTDSNHAKEFKHIDMDIANIEPSKNSTEDAEYLREQIIELKQELSSTIAERNYNREQIMELHNIIASLRTDISSLISDL